MTTQHTPGPWLVVNTTDVFTGLGASTRDGVHADANDGWRIADCDVAVAFVDGVEIEMGYAEKKANARLIAASPDLLDALPLLLLEVDESAIAGAKDYGWPVAVQKSRAAIAKATQP